MQRDRRLYQHISHIPQDGILRFFRWSEPTLSLGRFQQDPILEARCRQAQISWVRRPTGGRAILHGQDLCWSVIAKNQVSWGQSILETYQRLSAIFIEALAALGISAHFPQGVEAYQQQADCFASVTPADLTVAGQKLLGSAQVRNRHGFLQQTSLSWGAFREDLNTAILGENCQKRISLQQLRPDISQEAWVEILRKAFENQAHIHWRPWDVELERHYLKGIDACLHQSPQSSHHLVY